MFAGFGTDVDFKIDFGPKVEFGGDALDVAGEIEGVETLDGFDMGEDLADFVALQWADEVPTKVRWE